MPFLPRQTSVLVFIVATLVIGFIWEARPTPTYSSGPYSPPYTTTDITVTPLPTPRKSSFSIPKIGLQVGHWKNDEFPDELAVLRNNDGTHHKSITEVQVNLAIVNHAAKLLEAQGYTVDILPATVPPDYKADAFITVHADGNPNRLKSGFKIATSAGDGSGQGKKLVKLLKKEYKSVTGMGYDPYITDNMTHYYAFAWWKFDHSIDPSTPSAIVETGYLTNTSDRKIIAKYPHLPAQAIAQAVTAFVESK